MILEPPPESAARLELIDTHCHLDHEPLINTLPAVLARARAAGVAACVTVGTTVAASRMTLELAGCDPMAHPAVGIHPHEAETVTDQDLAQIEALAQDARVVAIGEVGLDSYYQHSSIEAQQRVLRAFVAMAQRRRLPLLIHCRNAYDSLLEIIRQAADPPVRGLIHCASGPPAFIRDALAMGFCISFAGNVTFPNAQALRELVPLVPDDRLLIETDAPFLAPQPVRGEPNEPAYVAHTAAHLARLRGISVEQMGRLTSQNARRLFGLH